MSCLGIQGPGNDSRCNSSSTRAGVLVAIIGHGPIWLSLEGVTQPTITVWERNLPIFQGSLACGGVSVRIPLQIFMNVSQETDTVPAQASPSASDELLNL
ncbi:hypothetical protein AVEN_258246-1 [Araneus ventricosus]|uniref:Uncharacterized protein n=1 Tax=Araneus ventricosus TaxID=182803 RepID=A0A4Y2M551_ARAVE|nr:hypothetical protein AVEN_258246-1 [Araneus ventricosus]